MSLLTGKFTGNMRNLGFKHPTLIPENARQALFGSLPTPAHIRENREWGGLDENESVLY